MKINLLCFAFFSMTITAFCSEPWEGTYEWDNEGHVPQYGNIRQIVELKVFVDQAGKVGLTCEIWWKPGGIADFGAVIERSAVVNRTLDNGTVVKVIPFALDDSADNTGTGEVEINGTSAILRVSVTGK